MGMTVAAHYAVLRPQRPPPPPVVAHHQPAAGAPELSADAPARPQPATATPPPAGNFAEPPARVCSEAPLLDETPGDEGGES